MSLVGEVVVGVRELIPDLKFLPVMKAPAGELTASAVAQVGSPWGGNSTFLVVTYLSAFGETLGSTELQVNPAANQSIQVALTGGFALPAGVQFIRAYYSVSLAGQENSFFQFTPAQLPFVFPIAGPSTGVSGIPPQRSSAWLPDMDGQFIGASSLYRMLNDALMEAANLCGGIPDYSGVPSVTSTGLYVLPGGWRRISIAWYDGYPVYIGRKDDVFRRSGVPGSVGGTLNVNHVDERTMIELWPQPARTSGTTTLSAPMALTDVTAPLVASNFTLGFGLALIGTELVYYQVNAAGQMTGIIRAMGGTSQQAWATGTSVKEVNLMVFGRRHALLYVPGNSLLTLSVPFGWQNPLKNFILSRVRETQRQGSEAARLMKEFQTAMKDWNNSVRQYGGPRQINVTGARGTETFPGLGSPFGGVLVP